MKSAEYGNLARVEAEHWYYRGKRQIVRYWLEAGFRDGGVAPVLVDCGAGTGRFAGEMAARARVIAVDDAPESLALLEGVPGIEARKGDCLRLPLADGEADMLTALDVLEHVDDDAGAVGEFRRVLKPGGLLVATVPACPWLWSDWDTALHHRRRYTLKGLRRLFAGPEWEVQHASGINVAALPAVWLLRKARWSAQRAEDRIPPRWINGLLEWLFVAPACTGFRLPLGVGALLVARRC